MNAAPAKTAQEAEIPEIDRIAGFPHPRETQDLYGHGAAESELHGAWASRRLHHAWLLTGNQGIGKATLAYRFARFLLANPDPAADRSTTGLTIDPGDPVFRQVAAQAHPDLLVLRRPWQHKNKRHAQAITVDEARRLRSFLGQTAAGEGWRVVIVDAADDLNISAANALLKSIEEPPEACILMLVAATPGRLPVTIRSRCRTLRMGPLAGDDLHKAANAALAASQVAAPASDALEEVLLLSRGSPGAALRLIVAEGVGLYRQTLKLLGQLPGVDYAAVHDLAESLTAHGAESRYDLFQAMLGGVLSRLVSQAASGSGALGGEAELAEKLIAPPALARWVGVWETLQREKAEADALNLDRKLLILETFFRLERAARAELD